MTGFSLVGNWLVWRVGNEDRVRIGEDVWASRVRKHKLSEPLIISINMQGFHSMVDATSSGLSLI